MSPTDVFAVGVDGIIVHYDGQSWTHMHSGTINDLHGIWNHFAVGEGNTILYYKGQSWTHVNNLLNNNGTHYLTSVWASDPDNTSILDNIFITGSGGTLLYNWVPIDNDAPGWLNGIWGSSAENVFVVGDYGTILHYDGHSWTLTSDNDTDYSLDDVWGSRAQDVFVVGSYGTILHYDGQDWTFMDSGSAHNLSGIWGSSSTNVFAVGYDHVSHSGTFLHYDGNHWTEITTPDNNVPPLFDIWGADSENIFIVGEDGFVLHLNGTTPYRDQLAACQEKPDPNACQYQFNLSPQQPDFDTLSVNSTLRIEQTAFFEASENCGETAAIHAIQIIGRHAAEFAIQDMECFYKINVGYDFEKKQQYISYQSNCRFGLRFSPTSVGTKQANLTFTFDDPAITVSPIPLRAKAVSAGESYLTLTPTNHDFGTVTIGRQTPTQTFTLSNDGVLSADLGDMAIIGADADDFSLMNEDCLYQDVLYPNTHCTLDVTFSPTTSGDKHTQLTINKKLVASLDGTANEPQDCDNTRITLATLQSGRWDDPNTWDKIRVPTEQDTVLIRNHHEVEGMASAKVYTLCLEPHAILTSADANGTPLKIQATDYLENRGLIVGRHGADENESGTCTQLDSTDTPLCAQRGANIFLSVTGSKMDEVWSGGALINHGIIQAGNGGQGQQYSAPGGSIIILGRNIINTNLIQAGNGGDILTPQTGQSGRGGSTLMFGGPGYLQSLTGSKIFSGHGGRCHPQATESQIGGQGGNLSLISQTNVHIAGAYIEAGQSDPRCTYPGTDGRVSIDPAIINLQNAQITGGNVDIYGGDGFVIELGHMNQLEATGNITLAVGKKGSIDLRGNTVPSFETQGQINIFTDKVLLDEHIGLKDLMSVNDPDQDLNFQGAKVLRGVSLTSTGKIVGQPGEVVTVILMLANNSPVPDTFTLTLDNAQTGQITELPEPVKVPGLSFIEIPLDVTLPDDASQRLNVQATSRIDRTVTANTDITLLTQQPASRTKAVTHQIHTYLVPLIPACPQDSLIDDVCSNQGQTLHSVTLTARASVSGGAYSGLNSNGVLISQAQILPDAVIIGGRYSGYIENQGTLMDITFVGAHLHGGTLGQTIKNESKISGVIENVTLRPGTHLIGGRMKGLIQGDPDQPALLEAVQILPDSHLRHVILGKGTLFYADVHLEEGVQLTSSPP
jgi:hypothetical protein